MTYKQIVEATARLEELERYSDLHEDSLNMLDEWWSEVEQRERDKVAEVVRRKIVDINEYRRRSA